MSKIIRVHMEPFDATRHTVTRKFDNTKLVALNTCPTWGIVRYEKHKTYLSGGRAMPLEAGAAAHEAYAGVRLADLWFNGHHFYPDLPVRDIATARANVLFGAERTAGLISVLESGEDSERATMLAALEVFGTSGFYEDPNDRRRTIANIEEALIAYVSRYPLGKTMPAVIGNFVGVEIPINMYLEIETDDGTVYRFNFTGRVDGVHFTSPKLDTLSIEENKTASRLDEAWRLSFTTSHQPTGYMLAVSSILKRLVTQGVVRGMAIPLPKTFDYGGIVNEPIQRDEQKFAEWAQWVLHTVQITDPYMDDPCNAPKYTHSCNRYFRPCSLIPFCDSPVDEREIMLEEMATEEWSPLESGNE